MANSRLSTGLLRGPPGQPLALLLQLPTLYPIFGDKRGLLDAVAQDQLARFVAEERAVAPIHAPAVGIVTTLLARPPDERDEQMLIIARDAAIAAIVDETSASNILDPAPHAIALRAHVDDTAELCAAEKSLLREWLERPTELSTA